MTQISRLWAAFAAAALVGSLTGCSSSDAPTASDSASPASESSSPTQSESKPSYCAPLAAAFEVKPPTGEATTSDVLAKFGQLLTPAAAAASADGKTDVAELLTTLAAMNSDPSSVTADEAFEVGQTTLDLVPVVMADCGINMMQ